MNEPISIVYQGIPASFSHLTALKVFGPQCQATGTPRFKDIFRSVESGRASFGIVPIENSLAGSVHENYDLLERSAVVIYGEEYMRIEHYLLGVRGADPTLNELKRIYSHPKALEQCHQFSEEHPHIETVEYSNTATAAQFVAESNNPALAAIASREAAALYGLQILRANLEDSTFNYTRFVIIAKEATPPDADVNKASVILSLPHQPGSLATVLQIIRHHNANLSKIESRPVSGKPFEYLFTLDFEFDGGFETGVKILDALKESVATLRLLGLYGSKWKGRDWAEDGATGSQE